LIITLEENDSFIQPDGVATMIVVCVKVGAKVIRFPYAANRSMSALIQDINAKIGDAPMAEVRREVVELNTNPKTTPIETIRQLAGESDGQIKKEDLVKCVKILPRDKDAPIDMEIGGIYRVMALPSNKVPYYEIIDDTDFHKAEIPRRVPAYPEEIAFFQKRKLPIPKEVGRFEDFFPCELCQKKIVGYRMDDNKYHGQCPECNHETIVDRRPVPHDSVA